MLTQGATEEPASERLLTRDIRDEAFDGKDKPKSELEYAPHQDDSDVDGKHRRPISNLQKSASQSMPVCIRCVIVALPCGKLWLAAMSITRNRGQAMAVWKADDP